MTTPQDVNKSTTMASFEPFSIMDALDDEAIIAELKGAAMTEYIYSFQQDGRTITGLSKTGVDAAVAEMAKKGEVIREMAVDCQWLDEAVVVLVKVQRFIISQEGQEIALESTFGSKWQPFKMTVHGKDQFGRRKSGETNLVEDPFFFEKALGKASRNAKRRLIPEDLITLIIKEAIEQGKVRKIDENGATETPGRSRRRRATPPSEESKPAADTTETPPSTEEESAPETSDPEGADQAADKASEEAPPIAQDITRNELAKGAKEVGYEGGPAVFAVLGVEDLDEWITEKATTATPLKEALELLRQSKSDDTPFDL